MGEADRRNVGKARSEGEQEVSKTAFITGIAGQDGSYLAELLLDQGYQVHGLVRAPAAGAVLPESDRLSHLRDRLMLHAGHLDSARLFYELMEQVLPDELYHLAGESFVSYSFDAERTTLMNNVNSTHLVLSAVKDLVPHCHVYFAGSSEMFGRARVRPQNEDTPFHPRSAYGVSKVAGFHLVRNYRETLGLHASSGILFNHESPRRSANFVTRKITRAAARISVGLQSELMLGNLDAKRDWGHAQDFVKAMWAMLQQAEPQDYVVATGVAHTVREFCELAFGRLGLDYQKYVRVDEALFRPAELEWLVGDPSRARKELDFHPSRSFAELVAEMVDADLASISQQ